MGDIEESFQKAISLVDEGRLDDADALCASIITKAPRFVDALNLRAQIALQNSNDRAPNFDLAIEFCNEAITISTDEPNSFHLLGIALRRSGNAIEAINAFNRALSLTPDFAEAAFEIGACFEETGQLIEAAASYEQACDIRPGFLEAHHNGGAVYRRLGISEKALAHGQIARAIAHHNPIVRFSLGISLEQAGDHSGAIGEYREAVRLRPGYLQAENNLGRLLEMTGEYAEAIEILEMAAERSPNDAALFANLGNAYIRSGRHEDAVAVLEQAVALKPGFASARNSLGVAQASLGDIPAAIATYRQAIDLDPEFAEAHENLAQALLQSGEFAVGWSEYAWRWKNPLNDLTKRDFEQPRWDGTPLSGKTLLLHAEQGLGDTLQMIRYIALVKKEGGRILFSCQRPLIRLLEKLPTIDEIFEIGSKWPEFDVHAPLFDLPGIFGTVAGTIPAQVPYIPGYDHADSINNAISDKLRIGFAWSGRAKFLNDPYRNRACPLSWFAELGDIPGVQLHSFQRDPEREELTRSAGTESIIDLGSLNDDFADDAKAMKTMDLIICVDTALAHLAGALDIPCWIILPKTADWRWLQATDLSPWYPSVKLYRQETPGQWDQPFSHIRTSLKQLSSARQN